MHQLCRLYVNCSIIINYSYSSLFLQADDLFASCYFLPDYSAAFYSLFFGFHSFFIFFAMRFAYRAAERLFRGKVLP
ncbi:MAG: hypothetical protein QG613_1153 [Pseudomonadota bacterium]|nr:hypothetical protein [Pseudomonadota bacterium]